MTSTHFQHRRLQHRLLETYVNDIDAFVKSNCNMRNVLNEWGFTARRPIYRSCCARILSNVWYWLKRWTFKNQTHWKMKGTRQTCNQLCPFIYIFFLFFNFLFLFFKTYNNVYRDITIHDKDLFPLGNRKCHLELFCQTNLYDFRDKSTQIVG